MNLLDLSCILSFIGFNPSGIEYYEDSVNVCDNNKRIQKLSEDLVFQESLTHDS